MKSHLVSVLLLLFLSVHALASDAPKAAAPEVGTKVVFLGTGTPNPDPGHSGNSVAIVVRDTAYVVDCGPGLVRRAAALSPEYGGTIKALSAARLTRVFFTHLHSDHTTGYPDLMLTPWVMGRDVPLEAYGPTGLKAMTGQILKAYDEDIQIRLTGLEQATANGWRVNVHEIGEGLAYKDENVAVYAFRVEHGNWAEAYGYKFVTPGRTVCISGDTRPSANLVENCAGADVLVHEVYSHDRLKDRKPKWQKYHPAYHTSTRELAGIATQVKPGLLVLYHQLYWGATDEQLIKEISALYPGKIVSAKDLDVL